LCTLPFFQCFCVKQENYLLSVKSAFRYLRTEIHTEQRKESTKSKKKKKEGKCLFILNIVLNILFDNLIIKKVNFYICKEKKQIKD